MDRFCTIYSFQPKTYAGLAKHTARYYSRHLAQQSLEPSKNIYKTLQSNETYTSLSNEYNTAQDRKVHIYAANSLSSTITVYNHIEKDKNADLAIADNISDAPDMCAKDDLIRRKVLFQTHDRRLAGEPATAESVTAKEYLQQIKCTLGDVNSLFADAQLHNLHTRLPFQSGRQYLSRLKADQHFFVYQNILSLIAFIISHRPFADKLVYAPSQFFSGNTDYPVRNIQQSLPDRATVMPIIISVNKTQLSLISGDNLSREARRQRSTPSTLLARFIPTTKIRNPLLKSQVYHYCIGKLLSPLENAAKSRILLACADGRTRQYYPTICAILADYEEQVLLTSIKKNCYCTRCTKHHNFNIHVSLATDTLHLLLKSLVIKMLDFMQDILDDIYPSKQKAIIQQLIAVVSPLFISKAPFALHFIHAVCNLVTLAQYKSHDEDTLAYIQEALERINIFKKEFRVYQQTLGEEKNFNYPKALDSICTRANSEAHHITIVKQFYSITNKKEYILQICLHNSQRTALLAADHATIVKQSQPSTTVDIQDRTYSTRNAAPKRRTLQAFKFYNLSTIIRPVHLVPRDLPNSTTYTTMSYYVNNYID
ncbi:hypothetical protein HBI88_096610 [Parastagonospora nodorum]|nr:hypothetical protein HBI97_252820 [Parastagonospora nodorum]KAH5781779.1 hypothetical protein HBI96_252020 [Parastagonospora nodorum]KAH5794773.1 hypothetical protein HBI94_252220 [Parastagonospora nodorum]KAH5838069.1 hypothetical protein HBI93_065490 [Parastagonospora nodorum]KAH5844027.1 hypothetical protein HBI91_253470 [Parastagonospora nodorum]